MLDLVAKPAHVCAVCGKPADVLYLKDNKHFCTDHFLEHIGRAAKPKTLTEAIQEIRERREAERSIHPVAPVDFAMDAVLSMITEQEGA